MSASWVGKILHWQGRRASSPHYTDNAFCLVLEETKDTVVAVSLSSEEVHFHGTCGTEAPSDRQFDEPFVMQKGAKFGSDGVTRPVARVLEGDDELTYEFWDGQPAGWGWDCG
jgi:hypothetical protein